MVLFDPHGDGVPALGSDFTLRIAGAESNYAIALARLGIEVAWGSRLGGDPFGDVIYETLREEDVNLDHVSRIKDAPTGVFFKWRSSGRSKVFYYRKGSAATGLTPQDVPEEALSGVRHVHLTGITMALSASARATVVDVARRAAAAGVTLSFDPNYRPALWNGPRAAAAVHEEVLPFVDWYLCGLEEGLQLHGGDGPQELLDRLEPAVAGHVVVRIGDKGAMLRSDGAAVTVAPAGLETVLDEVGAGDGFAAGFTYGLLAGWAPVDCARAGNLIAGAALRGTGDWETLPYLRDVKDQLAPLETQ